MKMHFVLFKYADGRAVLAGGGHETDEHGKITALGDYDRTLSPDEIVDGKHVRDYPPGTYDVQTFPPDPLWKK